MNVTSLPHPANSNLAPADALLSIPVGLIMRVLVLLAISILFIGTLADIYIFQIAEHPDTDLAKIARRFDLGHEPSIPHWFSSLLLCFNGLWLILIGITKHHSGQTYVKHWIVLGLIFIGLSIDEMVTIHEMFDAFLHQTVPISRIYLLPWVVVGASFVLTVFVFYFRFLLHLPMRFIFLFMASGGMFVGGAVGMETIAGFVIAEHGLDSYYHIFIQTIEESLEMFGSLLFFYTLATYWKHCFSAPRLRLT